MTTAGRLELGSVNRWSGAPESEYLLGDCDWRLCLTVDAYLAGAPEPQRNTLELVRASLRSILPDATETISYGMPAFEVEGKAVAGYAYFKAHCSYFPHSGTVLSRLSDELRGYDWSKGTLRFPVDQPLPATILRRLVATRLEELGLAP